MLSRVHVTIQEYNTTYTGYAPKKILGREQLLDELLNLV